MGCDIHAYIEYGVDYKDKIIMSDFARVNIWRDYALFGIMAGVRRDEVQLFEPRGIPKDLGFYADYDYYLWVNDEARKNEERDGKVCSRSKAEEYVKEWGCAYKDEQKTFVSDPDYHTASWLTADEFQQCLDKLTTLDYRYGSVISPPLKAIAAAMKVLPNARLVFWFDN